MSRAEEIDEVLDQGWVNSWMEKMRGSPRNGKPQPSKKRIFRVAEHIRETDPSAYEPKVVSIGPYHQNKDHLKPMDEIKLVYLNRLLDRNPSVTFEAYLKLVHGLNAQARKSYPGEIQMEEKEFSDMLLLDGCFIIELLLTNCDIVRDVNQTSSSKSAKSRQRTDDPIIGNMLTLSLVEFDMLLLENQIPFLVLERLFNLAVGSVEENSLSIVPIVVTFFKGLVNGLVPLEGQNLSGKKFYHLLHLFHSRFIVLPIEKDDGGSQYFDPNFEATESMLMTPCATDLINVGVKFNRKTDQCFSWHISPKQGIIDISPARLNRNSNSFYRNLIIFEQYFFPNVRSKVMAYVMFMSCLIDSENDLALLRRERIVAYTLDYQEATHFFRKLCKDSVIDYDKSYLSYLQDKSMEVWQIYDTKWTRYKARLKRSYLSNPISIIYIIVSAVLFVVLTILQTIYTVIGYYHQNNACAKSG